MSRQRLSTDLADIAHDVRYALRTLGRTPGFTVAALVTLALGIGASTAIYTVVDCVLLRPLAFPEPQQLVMIRPSSGSRVSAGYLHDWRTGSKAFRELAGWHDVRVNLTGLGTPREVLTDRVTTNFFAMLGAPPALGRTFTSASDLSRVEPEVILSHGFWQRQFGGDPSVIGRSMTLDGAPHTIVGVMPAALTIRTTELAESRAEIWLPLRLDPDSTRIGMGGFLHVVGRLAPGVTAPQAQDELSIIARQIEAEYPSYSRDWTVRVVLLLDATVRDVRPILLLLLGGAGMLLLVACTNVANLMLSRAASRQTEFMVRLAIGASRARLVRQVLTESVVLAVIGGLLGVLVANWGVQVLVAALPSGIELPRSREIAIDRRILSTGLLVTLSMGVLFGLAPALSTARRALHVGTRGVSGVSPSGRRGSAHALIVSQVALAVMLLAGAGLLIRSFQILSRVDPGFQPAHVLTLRTTLPRARYDSDARVGAFNDDLMLRVNSLPGVTAAGSIGYLPLSNTAGAQRFEIAGGPDIAGSEPKFALTNVAGGRYFEAMGIPLLRGRFPTDADTANGQPVFVIDDALARRHWPDTDAIGVHLTWRRGGATLSGPVIGVVGSVRWAGLAADHWATAYFWFPQAPSRELAIVVRTTSDAAAMVDAIAGQVKAIDPNQPVADIRSMQDLVAADLARPRFTMLLLAGFAVSALLLAAVGLYGVMAFGVTQRTREIGVRMALGAASRDVLRLVMRQGLVIIGGGLLLGIPLTLAAGGLVSSLLYGVTPRDPMTLSAAAAFLAAVATLAVYLPARRASRVNPVVALGTE